jgi:hypothetical protein
MRRLIDDRSQDAEIRDAVLVLDNNPAIDQGGYAGELGAGLNHPPIGPGSVITVPGKGANVCRRRCVQDLEAASSNCP